MPRDRRLDRAWFAAEVLDRLADAGEGAYEYDEEAFSLRSDDRSLPLNDIYIEYQLTRHRDRHALLVAFAGKATGTEPADVTERTDESIEVVPLVEPRAWLDDPFEPHVVIAEHWICRLAEQHADAFRPVAGLEGMERAIAALEARSSTRKFERIGRGLFVSEFPDDIGASRLLLPELLSSLRIEGAPVAALIDRDTLLVCGDDDADAMATMVFSLEERLHRSDRPMNGRLVRWNGSAWESFLPPVSNPSRRMARDRATLADGADYREQSEWLHAEVGSTVVAEFMVAERGDRRLVSHAAWAQGTSVLLPHTDLVTLVDGGQLVATCAWHTLAGVVGDLWQPQDMYPPRVLATGFPTDLGALAAERPVIEP